MMLIDLSKLSHSLCLNLFSELTFNNMHFYWTKLIKYTTAQLQKKKIKTITQN
jgi:hypothetical protein